MSAGPAGKLYTPQLLGLATRLAAYPLDRGFQFTSTRRSRSCGSTLDLGLDCDENGRVVGIGLRVAACAVGQASAAIMAQSLPGCSASDVAAASQAIEDWLADNGPLPDRPDFALLNAARPYSGRHEALLLPWNAACDALSNQQVCG